MSTISYVFYKKGLTTEVRGGKQNSAGVLKTKRIISTEKLVVPIWRESRESFLYAN